jgi:hypothetical protein
MAKGKYVREGLTKYCLLLLPPLEQHCLMCLAAAQLTQWHCAVHHHLQPDCWWCCNTLALQVLKHTLQHNARVQQHE